MGWTLSERLFLLFEDGRMVIFTLMGDRVTELKLFEQAYTDLVVCGAPSECGCVAYTRTGRLYNLMVCDTVVFTFNVMVKLLLW